MFSNFSQAFMDHLIWTLPSLILSLLITIMVWKRYTDTLWWTDFWVAFPVKGKMASWKKQTHGIENIENWRHAGMPPVEEELCATYTDKIAKVDPEVFNNATIYLKLTHQNERSPTSPLIWAALLVLTIAEAAGTGLLIAPFVASEITGNQMVWIGYLIALVMAFGLLGLTHYAGKEVNKRTAIKKALGSVTATVEGYTGEKISSGDDQSKDAGADPKLRFGSRVLDGAHDRGSLLIPFIALALLAVLLLSITWMRVKGLEIDLTRQVAEQTQPAASSNPFSNIPGFDSDVTAPKTVADASMAAQHAVNSELSSEVFSRGVAGAVVLAIIYVITQAIGFFQAFSSSFIGDGKNAYRQTLGETSFQSYYAKHVKPTIDRANMRLSELRSHLGRQIPKYRENVATMTCNDFYGKELHNARSGTFVPPPAAPAKPRAEAGDRSTHIAATHALATESSDSPEMQRIAARIIDEPDAERRKMILDIASEESLERRKTILNAVQALKKQRQESSDQARLEDEILGSL